jgi:hypothetical protein
VAGALGEAEHDFRVDEVLRAAERDEADFHQKAGAPGGPRTIYFTVFRRRVAIDPICG